MSLSDEDLFSKYIIWKQIAQLTQEKDGNSAIKLMSNKSATHHDHEDLGSY